MTEPKKLIAIYNEAIRQMKSSLEFELNQIEEHKKVVDVMKEAIKNYEYGIKE